MAVPGGTRASLREQLLRCKPVGAMAAETGADTGEGELKRSIGLFQLTAFGVGATIGTGIFIVLTQAVPVGGPATILSFVFAGVVAGLTAICYAELASTVPVSGSSYSYAYATLGEGVAIVVAACLLLEYGGLPRLPRRQDHPELARPSRARATRYRGRARRPGGEGRGRAGLAPPRSRFRVSHASLLPPAAPPRNLAGMRTSR
jgi:Amino acid permease